MVIKMLSWGKCIMKHTCEIEIPDHIYHALMEALMDSDVYKIILAKGDSGYGIVIDPDTTYSRHIPK